MTTDPKLPAALLRPAAGAVVLLVAAVGTVGAQGPADLPARPDAFVAGTGRFAFYSDARMNLHDFLVWRARSEEPVQPRDACLARLDDADRRAFQAAEARYRQVVRDRELVLDLRYHLAGWPGVEVAPDSATAPVVDLLDAALPAYRSCWWDEHDARNRRWIGDVTALLVLHEDSIGERLARDYGDEWQRPIPVDLAGYASFTGASTVVRPHHVLISAADPSYTAESGLEMVFHEASHTLVHPGFGVVGEVLGRVARERGMERAPRDTWHVLLFYSAGHETRRRLAETGTPGYEPYLYSEGLFDRAWPEHREPVERWWGAYLEGELSMEEAIGRVLDALR